MPPRSSLPYWWMLAGAFFFSWMALLTHILSDELPWQAIALVRTSLALTIAAAMTWQAGAKFVFFRPATLWLRSLAGSTSLLLTFYALTHTQSLAEVLVLTNMFPIWVALLSWPLLGTLPRWDVWLAIACGLAGVIVMQRPAASGVNLALVAAAGSSLTTLLAMLGLHRLKHLDPRSVVAHFSAVSALFCLAALVLLPRQHGYRALEEPHVLAMLLGVGVTATIGQLLLTKAFAAGQPAKVAVVNLTTVAFSALADGLYFERKFDRAALIGMALIIAPTIWLLWRSGAPSAPTIVAEDDVPPPLE